MRQKKQLCEKIIYFLYYINIKKIFLNKNIETQICIDLSKIANIKTIKNVIYLLLKAYFLFEQLI